MTANPSWKIAAIVATVGLLQASCAKEDANAQPAPAPPAPPKTTELTLLVTADEEGWLVAQELDGHRKGGAAEMLGQWIASEKYCPTAGGAAGACKPGSDATVALSTGNHWNGPAISSFFHGESGAEVMRRMGYQASALGIHDLTFGRDQFLRNRGLDGVTYLAANVKVKSPEAKDMALPAFKVIERAGVKLGVVGLTRTKILSTVMAGRMEGLQVSSYEDALGEAVPAAWAAGVDAVVVLVDECPSEMEKVVLDHPQWKISVVAGGHCHRAYHKQDGPVVFGSPANHYQQYVKAVLTFDKGKPAKERLANVDITLVNAQANAAPDAEASALVKKWKEKVDGVLGEEIGFTKAGLKQESTQLAKWISESIRAIAGADAAIVNKKGLRQGLPPGKITKGSVYSVLPFENTVLVTKLQGDQLLKSLENPVAVFGGVAKAGKLFKDLKGKAIDPAKTYSVATVDYLYFGGDGFEFEKFDPLPSETGMVWQTPVIEWTKAAQSTPQKPLEARLK